MNRPSTGPAGRPGNGGEPHAAGTEHAALADQARTLAPCVLAALQPSGYPGMEIVTLTTYSPQTCQAFPPWAASLG
jgi:hypothetical protein